MVAGGAVLGELRRSKFHRYRSGLARCDDCTDRPGREIRKSPSKAICWRVPQCCLHSAQLHQCVARARSNLLLSNSDVTRFSVAYRPAESPFSLNTATEYSRRHHGSCLLSMVYRLTTMIHRQGKVITSYITYIHSVSPHKSVRLVPGVTSIVPNPPNMVVVLSNQSRSTFGTLVSSSRNCRTRSADAAGFSSPCGMSVNDHYQMHMPHLQSNALLWG